MGIDLLSQDEKVCNFDCVYCQIGPTKNYTSERKIYIPVGDVIEELKKLPDTRIDYFTFSGRGEPALAANLGEAIKAVKLLRKGPVAVLTNSSLMAQDEVRKELILADFVVAKLDACSAESLQGINRSAEGVEFADILDGIKKFRNDYVGRMALQIMFIEDNKNEVNKLIYLANYIKPDEVQINTPLRRCDIDPLSKETILKIKANFASSLKTVDVVSVYDDKALQDIVPISDGDTLKRRGKRYKKI
ncbi:MAG: radical SAM protein [Candidatus Omnitrophota bacterium]